MDAAIKDDPLAILNRIMFSHDLDFNVCEPVEVVKVYNDRTVVVQPLTKMVSGDKKNNTYAEKIVEPIRVSLMTENHGGFFVEHPVMKGDTGWVFASDRNTSLIKQYNSSDIPSDNEGAQIPNDDQNLHKSHFGFFMPDRWITLPKQLVQELKYPKSKDEKVLCGGDYVIGGRRNAVGNLDDSALFGIVRDMNDNDVPFVADEEGHTRSLDGKYTGKYFWQRMVMLADGSFDIYGQGKKFSVRRGGLYRDDRLLKFLSELVVSAGDGIEVTMPERKDGMVEYKIANKGVIELESGDNVTIEPVEGKVGVFKISARGGGGSGTLQSITIDSPDRSVTVTPDGTETDPVFHLKVVHPQIGNGTITIQKNGVAIGSFSVNQNNNGTINIEVPDQPTPTTGVSSVDKKANTFGIEANPTTGDVKLENTGLTGAHIQQSGSARYAQITGGTDATHNGVAVKTKDVTVTLPVPLDIDQTEFQNVLANAIHVTLTQNGSAQTLDLVEKITLALNLGAANHSIKIDNVEVAKFFGTADVNITSGGGQGTPDRGAFWYDKTNLKIKNCRAYAGRREVSCSDYSIAANFSGTIYAILHHPYNSSPYLEVSTSAQTNDDEKTCMKIYTMSAGEITADYRNTPVVPLYE